MTTSDKPKKSRPIIDLENLPSSARLEIENLEDAQVADYVGIGNKKRKNWDTPQYNAAEGEQVSQNGNAFVVLGRDRHHNITSGYGGKGSYHCAAIDIVAGRAADLGRSIKDDGSVNIVEPDFKLDAARIYISQMSDPDTYFGLGMKGPDLWGGKGSHSPGKRAKAGFTSVMEPRSTVAIKADTVRLISRENIKLVTRTDKYNSQGGLTDNAFTGRYGIDLVGMNDFDGLQPMVKGDNLIMCLEDIVDSIASLRSLVENYIDYNNKFQRKVQFHTHPPAIPFSSVLPSVQDLIPAGIEFMVNSALNVEVPSMLQHSQEVNNVKSTYLDNSGGSRTEKYILSDYNRNN